MKILAVEKEMPGLSADDFESHLKAEALKAWELHQSGVIRELYFRADQSTAILMLECENVKEAREILDTLPLVRENLIDFEVIPLKPYPGFSRLFSKE